MIAYKLFRVRANSTLGPLFINRRQVIPLGEWLEAEDHPTKGFAHRPGWHASSQPVAPHLSERGRAWYVVKIEDYQRLQRPESQGGLWYLANRIKVVRAL